MKAKLPCDDTYPSYHRYPRPILVFPKKNCRKAAYQPIVRKTLCFQFSVETIVELNASEMYCCEIHPEVH
jgi:hypothetical protein